MSDDKIAEIRARHNAAEIDSTHQPGKAHDDLAWLLTEVERLTRERDAARAEVERQTRHIEELQQKIDAEKSCACSYDAPGDVCAAHSPALVQARAEVERLREALEMIRDADDDCRSDGLPTMPELPRRKIDAALAMKEDGR